ncbi:MAG TPA: NADH-quinone oxidoreductase subunit NuoN [Xanthomonadaceae bacterium]|nr:NADH-quinone oxidoreductase subunit NuoN [Xanthomonadaceae bacterium]
MHSWSELLPLLPEVFLLGMICVLLLADLYVPQEHRGFTHFLALMILAFTAIITLRAFSIDAPPQSAFDGMFLRDGVSDILKVAMYGVLALVFVYSREYLSERGLLSGEFYVLCLTALLGMMVLVSAGSLITVYLGLELLALSTYALVALNRDSTLSSEAAMKYFVLGALASGMLLYGMSMVYGATGSLDLATIRGATAGLGDSAILLSFGLVFVVIGVAFKFGAAPFHMWVPDVYQGSPTAITLFIGSVPKLAAFGMAWRLLDGGMAGVGEQWQSMLALLAVASLAIGNVVALAQTNLKRMLAYSTISHVGFLFVGLASGSAEGFAAAMAYVILYALMAAGAFGMIILLSHKGFEAEEIEDFKGLSRRQPWYALMMLLLMASLAGFPPLVGFFAKFLVLKAAVEAGLIWLAIAAVVFAVIGAYYYLRIIKLMYFDNPADDQPPVLPSDAPMRWALSASALFQLAALVVWGPLLSLCQRAFT